MTKLFDKDLEGVFSDSVKDDIKQDKKRQVNVASEVDGFDVKLDSSIEDKAILYAMDLPESLVEIEFEKDAPRHFNAPWARDILIGEKIMLTYNDHDERLERAGYRRTPSIHEVIDLLVYDAMGKTTRTYLEEVTSDMKGRGEFLSAAIQKNKESLVIYEQPQIKWNSHFNLYRHTHGDGWYGRKHTFTLPSEYIDAFHMSGLQRRCRELYSYLFRIDYDELPKDKNIQELIIQFPKDNRIYPMTIQTGNGITISYTDKEAASRGVKLR